MDGSMRGSPTSPGSPPGNSGEQARKSGLSNLRYLLGPHRMAIVLLAFCSVLAGVAEATLLAAIAQIGAALLNGSSQMSVDLGPVGLEIGVGTMIGIAIAMGVARIALQAAI